MNKDTTATSLQAQLFSRITFINTFLYVTVGIMTLTLAIVYNSPVSWGLAVLINGVLVPMSLVAHWWAKRDRIENAAFGLAVIWYTIAIGMIVVGERLYGVLLVTAILPVLMTMPYLSQRLLRRMVVASIGLVLIGSIGALFPPVITPTVPDELIAMIESFATVTFTVVVMLAIWQGAGRLQDASEGMRKAIAALQESERSLETKVEARTAELNDAFNEISDIAEMARLVNATLDVNEVVASMFNGLQTIFTFDQLGVFLLTEEDQRLRLKSQAGTPFPAELEHVLHDAGLSLDAEDSFAARAVLDRKSVFLPKVTEEGVARAGPTDKHIYQYNPMKSMLLSPLLIGDQAVGCIYFSAKNEAFVLDEEDIASIERYVTQLGTAIRNAQLFQSAEKARGEAESANETKGAFLANMSHEIRTPMNAIIGLTGLCLETELNPKQEDYLVKVDGAANALRGIIDDILDFSKLEAGKLEFENIPFSLNEVLDNLATICMVRCQDKHLELVFQRDPTLPDILVGDPTRMGQILINLAGNAIKFTEEGEVVIEIRQTARSDNRVSVHIAVRDSGIGMTAEQQGRLFQSFSQADNTITRQYGGTGLGLAISQQLTEMMDGKIQVDSEPGKGSSFHFDVEFEVGEEATSKVLPEAPPADLNVLIVDDNEPSRDILREYVTSFGYRATLAESGEQALELLQPEHDFDLVLLDWMMPGMTGLDVALAIRGAESPPKVILLSSWDMPSSEHEAMVDAFLAKPVKPSALLDVIMQAYGMKAVRRARARYQSTGPEDLASIRGARVLIVDDSDINLQIACELLEKIPFVLTTASDGEEAVASVKEHDYDCVLMDIQMPLLDGYGATAKIREDPRFDRLPILAMTANVMAEDRARTLEAGMNGHVPKPIDPPDLFKALLEAIPPGDYSDNLTGRKVGQSANEAMESQQRLPDALPGLAIRQGLSRVGGNESLYIKLLLAMVAEHTDCADTIEQLLADHDTDAVRGTAHKLRGIANNLGADDIGACAEAIERCVLDNISVSTEHVAALRSAMTVLLESSLQLEELAQPDHNEPVAGAPIDVAGLLGELKSAIAAFDPGATDILDRLSGEAALAAQINPLRTCLDNFDFAGAEQLLPGLEESALG